MWQNNLKFKIHVYFQKLPKIQYLLHLQDISFIKSFPTVTSVNFNKYLFLIILI
jgi:hypothetical protein